MDMLLTLDNFVAFAHGLDHPECVAWGLDGYVFAGGEAGQIYRVNTETCAISEFANTGGFILGLAFDGAGNLYACDNGKHCIQRITPDGTVSVYSRGAPDRPMSVPNYPVFDPHGNLWVSDSGGHHTHTGCLFRISPGGDAIVASSALTHFPNGLAIDPAGEWLYVVVSNVPSVVRVRLLPNGNVGEPQTVVHLPRTVPDGLAFDIAGNLYVSCYTPDRIYRVAPDGTTDIVIDDWESTLIATPTNIAFGGADMRTLFIASLGRWHLTKGNMLIPGARLAYPVII
jgi:gluconolactonase